MEEVRKQCQIINIESQIDFYFRLATDKVKNEGTKPELSEREREIAEMIERNRKMNELQAELNLARTEFEAKIKEIKEKYFENENGLTILPGNNHQIIGFAVDYSALKKSSFS